MLDSLSKRIRVLFSRRSLRCLWVMTKVKLLMRDYNSFLGILWTFLGPLSMGLVLYAVFHSHFGRDIQGYPLFLLLGIISLSCFNAATCEAMLCLKVQRILVLNTSVPREVIVLSEMLVFVYKFVIELALCTALSWYLGLLELERLVLVIPLVLALSFLSLGISFILALLHAFLRDFLHLWFLVTRLLIFATPVFYSLDSLTPRVSSFLYWCNPVTPILMSLRQCMMNNTVIDPFIYAHAIVVSVIFLVVGLALFVSYEDLAVERI